MKVFCDTNIVIAAFLRNHPHHSVARPILERTKAGTDHGFISAHSVAEVYAVITRLPGPDRVPAPLAWQLISENVLKNFTVIDLTAGECVECIANAAANSVEGGKTYDALILAAAEKSNPDRIYSTNVRHFQALAGSPLREKIVAP